MYHVWRREDGYVHACNTQLAWDDHYLSRGGFTLLLTTDDWPTAEARIREARSQVASR